MTTDEPEEQAVSSDPVAAEPPIAAEPAMTTEAVVSEPEAAASDAQELDVEEPKITEQASLGDGSKTKLLSTPSVDMVEPAPEVNCPVTDQAEGEA